MSIILKKEIWIKVDKNVLFNFEDRSTGVDDWAVVSVKELKYRPSLFHKKADFSTCPISIYHLIRNFLPLPAAAPAYPDLPHVRAHLTPGNSTSVH